MRNSLSTPNLLRDSKFYKQHKHFIIEFSAYIKKFKPDPWNGFFEFLKFGWKGKMQCQS